ncbi:MAG: argininosuccinate synthase [Methanomicrobia archaeon]|nr:argininosuccinate synthase [Methanomicrobia archaeon]
MTNRRREMMGLLVCICVALLCVVPSAQAATTQVHVVKYAADNATILNETTVNYTCMEANLPVHGDGVTHYYFQGPTFSESDPWNPDEDVNVESRDYGAVKGTNVKDLCDLVGGMSPGDEVRITATDGFNKWFGYTNVYEPQPRQGPIVLCWYNGEESITGEPQGTGYPDIDYYNGMRLIFFADTSTNPWGYHCFGDWDMHECLDEKYWHYFDGIWPSSSGLSITWVDTIAIYSTIEPPKPTPTPLPSPSPSPSPPANLPNESSRTPASAPDDTGTKIPYWSVIVIVLVLILIGGLIAVRDEWKRR